MLSQKAEDTLNQFAAVKKAEVNFQTSLGNRKGQLGINLIGAFAERQNNAFGWQVRVYGAQQDGKGFNAGVFYRRRSGDILFGANAFVDYENHKLGNFYRYSIGGEAQNKYGSFAANYYVPITDEKRKDGGVIFSRKGYDAKLRLNIPNAKFLKAAVDYYNFGDEHGAESDDGFRYGAEAHLIPGLRLGVFYDNGGEELGGEVSYIHTIGEVQQAQTANEQWTPDLFAAVSREHSQRIVSVSVVNASSPPPSFIYSGVNVVRPITATIGSVNIPAGYAPSSVSFAFSIPAPANTDFSVNANGVVLFTAMSGLPPAMTTAIISIGADVAAYATALTISLDIGAVVVGRLADVQGTLLADHGLLNAAILSTYTRFRITLPPGGITYPFVATVGGNPTFHTAAVITLIREAFAGNFPVGPSSLGFRNFVEQVAAVFTLTIVAGSEQIVSTLYAQADIPFNIPGFLPQLPQLPKLAFADPVILAPAPQRRESNIKPPPLAAEKARVRRH